MANRETFIETVQQNSGIIYNAASLYTSNKEDREDLVQEIVYQLWKSYDSFQQHSSRSTWIYRVAMNVAIYHLKKSKKKPFTTSINQETLKIQGPASSKEDEKRERIQKQIKTLSL